MRHSLLSSPLALVLSFVLLVRLSCALNYIEAKSLNLCQENSAVSATLFDVLFTPNNRTAHVRMSGVSQIEGNITAEIELLAYGYAVVKQTIDPCTLGFEALCPLAKGPIPLDTNFQLDPSVMSRIPGVAYTIPDLDGVIKIVVKEASTGRQVACVQTELLNGQTVDQMGVSWATAIIAGLGLVASAITSGLGHSNTAAHVAANALSLFGYFQAQAMVGLTAVEAPPIVQAWTQNFMWSMGIMNVGFMQSIFAWYQKATGGTPSNLLGSLKNFSVEVQKRSLDAVDNLMARAANDMIKRSNIDNAITELKSTVIVRGIERVAFRAGIEETNLFMTGLTFYILFVVIVISIVLAFKGICELCIRAGWFKSDKFVEFRNGWLIVLKGILFRLTLIGYPQMCILCLWEMTQRDSAAEVVLAVFFFIAMNITLAWAALKVILIAKRSVSMHKNPAYILYSDLAALNKWGFLYVQFRATAYYFIVPVLGYTLAVASVIALGQKNGIVQAVALLLIQLAFLVGVSLLRPWMDKKTNSFNIAIVAVNLFNAVLLLIWTRVFKQAGVISGVCGVVFFVVNAAFSLVLLILLLIASCYAIFSKNPDIRYQPMRDDRASFTKSKSELNTELDALGVTARGQSRTGYKSRDLDDDTSSGSSMSLFKPPGDGTGAPVPPPASYRSMSQRDPSRRSVDASAPLYPGNASPRRSPSNQEKVHNMYSGYNDSSQPGHNIPLMSRSGTPDRRNPEYQSYTRTGSSHSNSPSYRQQANRSPWQRGAGYE